MPLECRSLREQWKRVSGSYSLPAPRRRLDVAAHESEGSAFREVIPGGAEAILSDAGLETAKKPKRTFDRFDGYG